MPSHACMPQQQRHRHANRNHTESDRQRLSLPMSTSLESHNTNSCLYIQRLGRGRPNNPFIHRRCIQSRLHERDLTGAGRGSIPGCSSGPEAGCMSAADRPTPFSATSRSWDLRFRLPPFSERLLQSMARWRPSGRRGMLLLLTLANR